MYVLLVQVIAVHSIHARRGRDQTTDVQLQPTTTRQPDISRMVYDYITYSAGHVDS